MQNLTFLKIQHLIIHELPKHGQTDGVLSDAVSPLPDQVRHFFEERIRTSLGTSGIPIGFVAGHSSKVPAHLNEVLGAKRLTAKKVVSNSQGIAKHLFGIQTGVHSEGLLCIATCSLKDARGIGIIKLEMEEGVRARLKGAQGNQHFEIEVLDDLMLTQHTRVFKVALFTQNAANTVEALASDSQRARGQFIASYFLDDFLGCALLNKPDVSTKAFFEAAEAFINGSVTEPILQSRYHTALIAELASNNTTVRPRTFADAHLEVADRRPFLGSLAEAGVPNSFQKDTGLVNARIVRTRLNFEGDVSVTMPPEALNTTVTVTAGTEGRTRLALESRLEDVRGAR
jgi:hypothetical protein